MDIFERRLQNYGPLGKWAEQADGYYMFPKLEGEISNRMIFRGKERLVWSLNNYLGLANHPEVRQTDTEATAKYGLAYPMGARMMSGQTEYHQQLEAELAAFVQKEASYLLNFGYQGMVSIIDALLDRKDVVVYDSESHACIIDGLRMHLGKRFVFKHNDIESFEKQLQHAKNVTDQSGGGILVITEGVFGMAGDLGIIDKIAALKRKYHFRLLVDDAHGFGTMGKTGIGTGEAQGVQDQIDVYFSTFAKSMAGIGAFVGGDKNIISFLQHNMRSQVYAKALPMPLVLGALKRLELLKTQPQLREKLWTIVNALQSKLRENNFNLGRTQSPVTPVFLSGGIPEAAQLTYELREKHNVFCSIVVYPVVPKDVIMLRLIPTAVHTLADVEETVQAFVAVRNNLLAGKYEKNFLPDLSLIQ